MSRRTPWSRAKHRLLATRAGYAARALIKGIPRGASTTQQSRGKDPQVDQPVLRRSPEGLVKSRLGASWPDPPQVPVGTRFNWSLKAGARNRHRFDIKLFEELNAEYADKPLVPVPRGLDPESRMQGARNRLTRVHERIDLTGTAALELGCGQGQEVWLLKHKFDCDAHGVDIVPYPPWLTYSEPGVRFSVGDAAALPYADNSFDRIVSFAVWEHIPHPYAALAEAKRVLRPGGIFWLYANLHRGPSASHRYREVYFPWPQLLFEESVIDEFYERRGSSQRGYSWINRLTYDTYAKYFKLLDFELIHLQFSEKWNQEFYDRFADILIRYPLTDLKRDFFTAVLVKP